MLPMRIRRHAKGRRFLWMWPIRKTVSWWVPVIFLSLRSAGRRITATICPCTRSTARFPKRWCATSCSMRPGAARPRCGRCCWTFLIRLVSPELLPADENGQIAQKTEDLVGPYELHDFFLYHLLRFGSRPRKLFRMAKYAYGGRYPDDVIRTAENVLPPVLPAAVQALVHPGRPEGRLRDAQPQRRLAHAVRRIEQALAGGSGKAVSFCGFSRISG